MKEPQTPKLETNTAAELMAEDLAHKPRVRLDRKNRLIVLDCYRDAEFFDFYEVELSRCNSPARVLDWAIHLSEKPWMSAEMLGEFLRLAFKEIGIEREWNC